MEKIKIIINKKPAEFLILSFIYLILTGFLKWFIHPPIGALWYLAGGFAGIYFLDVAEVFFNLQPSPFRTILFSFVFAVAAFFIVTSSGSILASGLVLSIFFTLVLWQVGEWQIQKNLTSWYRMIAGQTPVPVQRWVLIVYLVAFLVVTFYFIRA
jgi:hypothetical protein